MPLAGPRRYPLRWFGRSRERLPFAPNRAARRTVQDGRPVRSEGGPDEIHPVEAGPPSLPNRSLYKVALVEDQQEIRERWTRLLESFGDFKCVCACSSGEEALRAIPAAQPDVVLMDIFLPGMSGIECTARLKGLLPQTQILILTASDDEEMVFPALEAGADGYLLKQSKPADLRRGAARRAEGRGADDQRHRPARGRVLPAKGAVA